ncbi:MAG TPA: alpha/beta fold hydrolase [Alphaproteobacteria bacterium]|jgi:predicted alpha/beta-fold hydrolase
MEGAGRLGEIAEAIDSEARSFRPRFPWLTGDLQTVRNMIVRPRPSFADAPAERLAFAMDDGTDDVLLGDLHRPRAATAPLAVRPLAVLIHGLTGCGESFYVLSTARALLDRGAAVLRLNLRGAGPNAGSCREQHHAGRTGDIVKVLGALDPALTRHGIVAVGYSLGGNVLLKLLGEAGAGTASGTPIRRAAAVSPPVDLAAAAHCILRRRNRLYHRYLLARMKDEARATRGGLPSRYAAAVETTQTIVDYDDSVVAPRYGFASAADYYERCSAARVLGAIRVPCLVIHSRDDPWIPAAALEAASALENPRLRIVLTARGGHVGFHGAGARTPWHDALIADFLLQA